MQLITVNEDSLALTDTRPLAHLISVHIRTAIQTYAYIIVTYP